MKILTVTHDVLTYEQSKKKMRWTRFPHLFKGLGHEVITIRKPEWWKYPFIYAKQRPDIVISAGKIAGLITSIHHMMPWKKKAIFVHDLTDHFDVYKSERRIWFLRNHHDYVTSPTIYNLKKFNCHDYIPNGSDFKLLSAESKLSPQFDAVYIGQTQSLYNLGQLKKECDELNLNLQILTDLPYEELPNYISKSKVCVYPISWDSSVKMYDYAALGMPVVAPKPNLAEEIGYPAHYCENLGEGIRYLIDNTETAKKLGDDARNWFEQHSGDWKTQATKYSKLLESYLGKRKCAE
ncbi:MAG: glycosyltransferase [Candidatus Woesearchaeota archaeon]